GVLVPGEIDVLVADRVGEGGQLTEIVAVEVPERHVDRDHGPPRNALGTNATPPPAFGGPGEYRGDRRRQRRRHRLGVGPRLELGALELFEEQLMDMFLTPAPDHELQPALPRLVEVRMLDMDVEEGVAGGQDLRAGHEVDGL